LSTLDERQTEWKSDHYNPLAHACWGLIVFVNTKVAGMLLGTLATDMKITTDLVNIIPLVHT